MKKIWESKKPEWLVFFLFAAAYILISVFHEPWFDEAQAWQIAKCAGLKDILFEIPHYEGHPPLWYLVLLIPAKAGIPFEIGLKSIGGMISFASVALILFHSHMPRPLRLLLPFSFFIFYQYGVIVRPYGLMLLLLLLLGQQFAERNTHPRRIVLLMALLCMTSAYGIVISGGISLCLVWELLKEKGFKQFVSKLFTDVRTRALLELLLLALLLIWEIMPRSDTWVTSANRRTPLWVCVLCTLFTFIGDCLVTDSSWFRTDTRLLQTAVIPLAELLACCMIGLLIWALILSVATKKNLKFMVVPYCLFALFSASVYVSAHHLGIALLILLFWLEAAMGDKDRFEIGRAFLRKAAKTDRDKKLFGYALRILVVACLIIPAYWTVSASLREIQMEYSYGRTVSGFLLEHGLQDRLILSSFGENSSGTYGKQIGHEDYMNTDENSNPVLICAYFDRNICFNLGDGSDSDAYMHYRIADYETSLARMREWEKAGAPDVLLGKPELAAVYGDELTYTEYSLVMVSEFHYIWKNKEFSSLFPVFLRSDLLEGCGLEALEGLEYIRINGFSITEEMKERFYNGEPIEEILKPYLDAMFGEA